MAGRYTDQNSHGSAVLRQLPFAVALALTRTAQQAATAVERRMPEVFDRPTPFTRNSVTVRAARKGPRPEAAVLVKPIAAAYLLKQETGATIAPTPGHPIAIPVQAKTNQFGNLPRAFWQKLRREQAAKPYVPASAFSVKTKQQVTKYGGGIFVVGPGHPTLPPGIYQRPPVRRAGARGKAGVAGKLKLLVALQKRATYERRFGFADTVSQTVAKTYAATFGQAFHEALRSAAAR